MVDEQIVVWASGKIAFFFVSFFIQTRERHNQNIVALAEFAFAMVAVLEGINRDCFNDFKLRVGMCNGPLVAGN